MSKERIETVLDTISAAVLALMAAGLFVLWTYGTPEQSGAECDRQRAEIEAEALR